MASDDPAVSLPVFDSAGGDDASLIEAHLSSVRKHRHLDLRTLTSSKQLNAVTTDIYHERIRAERDTVDQDWFDHPTTSAPYSSSSTATPSRSTDRLRLVEDHVKLNVRRAGSKATDTFRKIGRRRRSLFSSNQPRITLQPDDHDNDNDIPLVGVPIAPQRTNSTFNTITLPAFDLARYRSTSSRSTLSTVDFVPQIATPTPTPTHEDEHPAPPDRVPTPPPFPTSPDPGPPSGPGPSFSPSFPSSPFLNLQALAPLSEHPSPRPAMTPLSSSPASSLHDFPRSSSPAGAGAGPHHHRRTLTIDDYSPPSRRDTGLSSFLSRGGGGGGGGGGQTSNHHHGGGGGPGVGSHSILSHFKNSLHLHHASATSSSAPSSPRPETPPAAATATAAQGGGLLRPSLSRSPTSTNSLGGGGGARSNRHRAKEELQKLLTRRKNLLSRRGPNSRIPIVPGDLDGDEDPDVEGGGGGGGQDGTTDEEKRGMIDREIFERLKVLGALVEETERVETDVLWEHQRGLVVFGLPKFSSAALFEFDPSVWTDDQLNPSPYTPRDFPCRPYWRWRDQEFMVDMGGDRDEEGWSYAVFFHSKHWRGEPSLFRSFVRRRRWVRTRIYIPLPAFAKPKPATTAAADDTIARSPFRAIDGTEIRDAAEDDANANGDEEIHDLKSACGCLPLTLEDKEALYHSLAGTCSTTTTNRRDPQYHAVYIPPTNPFIPFRVILEYAKLNNHHSTAAGGSKELIWRQGIREINERRVKEVVKKVARIDRERLRLWKTWLRADDDQCRDDDKGGTGRGDEDEEFECSEWSEWRAGEKAENWTEWIEEHQGNGDVNDDEGGRDDERRWGIKEEEEGEGANVEAEDFADRQPRPKPPSRNQSRPRNATRGAEGDSGGVGRPDLEDVWDLIESRLDNILALFDYHLTRLSFLRLVLSCHPLASTPFPSTSNGDSHSRPNSATKFTHKHEGYDMPFEERRKKKQAEWEKRLKWVLGVREEVDRMAGGGGGPPVDQRGRSDQHEKADRSEKEKERLERSRSERRVRKGKQRAVYLDQ